MKLVEPITEHEMIALFLQTEIQSVRHQDKILTLLQRDGQDISIVEMPNLQDVHANAYRRQLLGDFRGYGQHRDLFETFPEEVAWYRAVLSKEDLSRVRYIDYSYWNELSGGSRLPSDAADNIRAGLVVYDVSNAGFWKAAQAVEDGIEFPELILVGASPSSLLVLEGHLRLTAYFLVPEHLSLETTVLVGLSPDFTTWE